MDGLRNTGWGFFPFPGEKNRAAKAKKKVDDLLDRKKKTPAKKADMTVDVTTTYDFASGNTKVTAMASFNPRKEDLTAQKDLRERMINELLGEVLLEHEADVTTRDISWDRIETTDAGTGEVESVTIIATIDLEDS